MRLICFILSFVVVSQGYADNPKICAFYLMKGTEEGKPLPVTDAKLNCINEINDTYSE